MDISRAQLVALRAGGSAVPPDGGQAGSGFANPACGSASTGSTADMAAAGHAGGLHS